MYLTIALDLLRFTFHPKVEQNSSMIYLAYWMPPSKVDPNNMKSSAKSERLRFHITERDALPHTYLHFSTNNCSHSRYINYEKLRQPRITLSQSLDEWNILVLKPFYQIVKLGKDIHLMKNHIVGYFYIYRRRFLALISQLEESSGSWPTIEHHHRKAYTTLTDVSSGSNMTSIILFALLEFRIPSTKMGHDLLPLK